MTCPLFQRFPARRRRGNPLGAEESPQRQHTHPGARAGHHPLAAARAATAARGCGAGLRLPGFSPASRAAGRQARSALASPVRSAALYGPLRRQRCHRSAVVVMHATRPQVPGTRRPASQPSFSQAGSQRAAFSPLTHTHTQAHIYNPKKHPPPGRETHDPPLPARRFLSQDAPRARRCMARLMSPSDRRSRKPPARARSRWPCSLPSTRTSTVT